MHTDHDELLNWSPHVRVCHTVKMLFEVQYKYFDIEQWYATYVNYKKKRCNEVL